MLRGSCAITRRRAIALTSKIRVAGSQWLGGIMVVVFAMFYVMKGVSWLCLAHEWRL
jgi:hypothetical protein